MGLVLGKLTENSLAQAMIIFDQQWTGFLGRPIAMSFFALALLSVFAAPIKRLVMQRVRLT